MNTYTLAIASGKGGTGKTTVSTALALASQAPAQYLDCDVEAPNGHLFLTPEWTQTLPVNSLIPVVDQALCDGCGKCSDTCQFNAIVSSEKRQQAWLFPELCHSCGGCQLVCPTQAITEVEHGIGEIKTGLSGTLECVEGRMNIGESMSSAVIHAVKKHIRNDRLTILDCPPGVTCPMIMATKHADFTLLVTEPTPFGLHDLKLAVETVRQLGVPFAVAINRFEASNTAVEAFCRDQNIEIMLRIPDSRAVAQGYAMGKPLTSTLPQIKESLANVLNRIGQIINKEHAA